MTTSKPRWWPLFAILIIATAIEILVWTTNSGDTMQQVISTWVVATSRASP